MCIRYKKKYHSQNLAGGLDGGQYLTDITNGQITGMFNFETNNWDPELCRWESNIEEYIKMLL